METAKGNEIICIYMGGYIAKEGQQAYDMDDKFPNGKDRQMPEVMQYHTSWEWLMPVIADISKGCEEPEELDDLKYPLLLNDKEQAWHFVVDYITENPRKKVIVLLTDDDRGLYSIIEESGQTLESDFESENEAKEWAKERGWKVVDAFNV